LLSLSKQAEDRGRKSEGRGQRAEDRGRRAEVRGQKSGGRGQRSGEIIGDGRWARGDRERMKNERAEVGSQRAEDRRQEIGEGAGMAPFFVIPERFYRGTRTSCGFPLKTCENDSDGGTCGMTAVVEYAGKVI